MRLEGRLSHSFLTWKAESPGSELPRASSVLPVTCRLRPGCPPPPPPHRAFPFCPARVPSSSHPGAAPSRLPRPRSLTPGSPPPCQAQLSHPRVPSYPHLGPALSCLSQKQLTLVPDSDLSQSIPVVLLGHRPQVPWPLAQHSHTWGAVSSLSHLSSCPHGLPGGCPRGQASPCPCRDHPSFFQRSGSLPGWQGHRLHSFIMPWTLHPPITMNLLTPQMGSSVSSGQSSA